MSNALSPCLWRLERYPAHQAVHFIAKAEQMFSYIAAILPSDTGDESFFSQRLKLPIAFVQHLC